MPDYIRCRDTATGHEVDVDARTMRPGLEPVADYPRNSGPGARPRPAKHFVAKDGKPARRRRPTPTDPATPPTPAEQEQP